MDAKKFFDDLAAGERDSYEGVYKRHSSGVLNGSLTIFVPDSQLPNGLLSYSSSPTEPTYSVKVYSGDVYAAYKQGASAGRDWCPGHDYTGSITRLQFCSVAVRMAEKMLGTAITPAPSGTFTDTDSEYVRKAVTAGITNGMGDGAFAPGGILDREQMATFLYRTLQYVKNNSDIRYTAYDSKLGSYTDAGQLADWSRDAMAFMNALGLVNGTSAATLSPNANCTIEQALIVANRSLSANVIGWYQSLGGTEKNVTDSGVGGNKTKRCFYDIPGDIQGSGLFNQLRYLQSERFWVTGAAQTRDWLTQAERAQGDYIRMLKMLDPYTGDTLYIEACNFRPVKAD